MYTHKYRHKHTHTRHHPFVAPFVVPIVTSFVSHHIQKSRLPHPISSLILKKSTSCLNSSLSSPHPSLFIQFIAATAASITTTEHKKKLYRSVLWIVVAVIWKYFCDKTVSVMIFLPKTFPHTTYFDWKRHPKNPTPPTSKLLPDSHTKIFLSPFSFCSDCCCCCHHLHIILPRTIFNQPSNQPTNHPIYKCFLCYMDI